MTGVPAFIRNGRLDILAINPLGQALYSEAFANPQRPVNLAQFCFLDERAHRLYPDWSVVADTTVALSEFRRGQLTDQLGQSFVRRVSGRLGIPPLGQA